MQCFVTIWLDNAWIVFYKLRSVSQCFCFMHYSNPHIITVCSEVSGYLNIHSFEIIKIIWTNGKTKTKPSKSMWILWDVLFFLPKYPHHLCVRWPITAALVSLSWPISWDWFHWRIYNTGWSSYYMASVLQKLTIYAQNELFPAGKIFTQTCTRTRSCLFNGKYYWPHKLVPSFSAGNQLMRSLISCQQHPCVQWPVPLPSINVLCNFLLLIQLQIIQYYAKIAYSDVSASHYNLSWLISIYLLQWFEMINSSIMLLMEMWCSLENIFQLYNLKIVSDYAWEVLYRVIDWNDYCKQSTHLPLDKIAAIWQMVFSDTFSWMKMYESWWRFHWILFLRAQLIIYQHWFR